MSLAEEGGFETGVIGAGRFKAAHAAGSGDADWARTSKACIESLGDLPRDANLGFLYATDVLASDLGSILTFFRERTGIQHWVGTVGMGVVANKTEFYGRPALSCLVMSLPAEKFRLFSRGRYP